MSGRILTTLRALTMAALAAASAFGQVSSLKQAAAAKNWTPPRTADGHPDLQGVWTNATLTPFQRPLELGAKEFFTEEEAAAFEKQRIQQTDVDRPEARRAGDPGAYNNVWFDRGNHVVESRRTSLIVDPPNGRVPPMTPEAQKRYETFRAELARHPADGPEDRLLTERCILFGAAGPPMLPEPYNNNYQIVQSPGYVAILPEMNHDARIIPVNARPPLAPNLHQWKGDPHGRWEGDTLVVETANFTFNNQSRFGVSYLDGMTDQNLRVVERFARTSPDTILYRATVDDPTVYTRPWTVEISMTRREGSLFEYACNEGNYGMSGILSGARADEKKAASSSR
jgi:hypothetical protein